MAKHGRVDKVEAERRRRIIQEWLIDDWHFVDIRAEIVARWKVSERQAERYIADARQRWTVDNHERLEVLRHRRIDTLRKLKRSLKDIHKGSPEGIRAILAVEKEINKIQDVYPAEKHEVEHKGSVKIFELPDNGREPKKKRR